MFGIVSTGPSSLSIDLTYDRKRLDQAINKITGSGLAPKDILDVPEGAQGPPEVRYRAHVAFSTANDIIGNLAQVHNRRKAFIYVSNGYDFNPFQETRKKQDQEQLRHACQPIVDSGDGTATIRRRATRSGQQHGQQVLSGRSRLGAVVADARREPRERHDVHDRSERPRRHARSRREGRHGRVAGVRARPRRTACGRSPS